MPLEQKLQLKFSQKLIMTPSLQQAIKLLQMSKLDLLEEINQELEDNPALEEGNLEGSTEEVPAEMQEAPDPAQPTEDLDVEAYFQNYLDGGYTPPTPPPEQRDLPSFEQTLSKPPDLADHLHWQLNLSSSLDLNHDIGRAIIGNIDEDGYLEATVEEIAAMGNWPPSEVHACLRLVQQFDPAGVGARNLVECLMLQVNRLDLESEEEALLLTIIQEHLAAVRARKYPEIAKVLDCSLDEVHHAVQVLKQLDPKPGQRYGAQSARYVVPDVFIVKLGEVYKVVLNEDGMPRLRLSPAYRRMLKSLDGKSAKEAREYVKEKCRSALRLIKSVEERQRTIHKVAASIVKHQREFLDRGVQSLRPLILKDVAVDIGMHESTVSRVVNNKFMHTPRGIFEMRYFFHSGIHTDDGEDMSSLAVKEKIKDLVDREDAKRPLSDAAIVNLLGVQGIKIARRTVAKYREELRIPSSTERRKAALGP